MKVYYPDLQTECPSIGEAMKRAKPGDIIYIIYDTGAIEEYEMPYAKLEQINKIEQLQERSTCRNCNQTKKFDGSMFAFCPSCGYSPPNNSGRWHK